MMKKLVLALFLMVLATTIFAQKVDKDKVPKRDFGPKVEMEDSLNCYYVARHIPNDSTDYYIILIRDQKGNLKGVEKIEYFADEEKIKGDKNNNTRLKKLMKEVDKMKKENKIK